MVRVVYLLNVEADSNVNILMGGGSGVAIIGAGWMSSSLGWYHPGIDSGQMQRLMPTIFGLLQYKCNYSIRKYKYLIRRHVIFCRRHDT